MPLFPGAASACRAFRPGLPEAAVALLTDAVRDTPQSARLGLGTGTGQVPAALHEAVMRIHTHASAYLALRATAGPLSAQHRQTVESA